MVNFVKARNIPRSKKDDRELPSKFSAITCYGSNNAFTFRAFAFGSHIGKERKKEKKNASFQQEVGIFEIKFFPNVRQ